MDLGLLMNGIVETSMNCLVTGGVARARAAAKRINDADLAIIDKRRPEPNLVKVMNVIGWWMEIRFLLLLTVLGFFLINTLQQSLFGILRGLEDLRPESLTVALQNLLACAVLGFFVFQQLTEPWLGALILMLTRFTGTIFVSAIIWKKYLSNLKNYKNDTLMLESAQLWREAVTLGFVLFLILMQVHLLGILLSSFWIA